MALVLENLPLLEGPIEAERAQLVDDILRLRDTHQIFAPADEEQGRRFVWIQALLELVSAELAPATRWFEGIYGHNLPSPLRTPTGQEHLQTSWCQIKFRAFYANWRTIFCAIAFLN